MRLHLPIFAFFLFASVLPAAIELSARFDPARIAAGDTARYIVEITESDTGAMPRGERVSRLPLPDVDGLSLRNGRTSTSQRTNIVNLSAEYQYTQQLIFDAVATAEGEYRVPSFRFTYKNQTLVVPEATLSVLERGANAGPAVDELIFLEAPLPDSLFVGQSIRATVTLFVSDTVRLQDLGGFERRGDAFAVSELPPEAERGTTLRNGRPYTTYSWPFKITPLSAGTQELGFRFEVIANLPDTRGGRQNADPFGIRGFGSFFDSITRPQRFNLFTEDHRIEVRPLPETGKPDAFTGGIGDFSMQVSVDREETTGGEPVMLSVKLSGTGNFSRLGAPAIDGAPAWRAYAPDEHLETPDALAMEGSKRFDYVMMPQEIGQLEIPAVRFAFFDPQDESYVELSSPPIPVTVAPAPNAPAPRTGTAAPQEQASLPELPRSPDATDALLALDYRTGAGRGLAPSRLSSPFFWTVNALALAAFATAALLLRHRHRLAAEPGYALARAAARELKRTTSEAADCAAAGDAPGFYRAAQDSLRLAATRRLRRNLRAAGYNEIAAHFKALRLPPHVRDDIREIFTRGDHLRFGADKASTDLAAVHDTLRKTLRKL